MSITPGGGPALPAAAAVVGLENGEDQEHRDDGVPVGADDAEADKERADEREAEQDSEPDTEKDSDDSVSE